MISVIIPVYNVASYLPACLDSVLGQTFRDLELILVNDGSTDGSDEICNDYACRDARVTVLHQENAGPAAARNAALDVARGEYVAFIDSDDVVHRQYLEVLVRHMELSDADIVQAPYQIVPHDTRADYSSARLSRPLPPDPRTVSMTGQEALLAMLYQQGTADSSPCKLFRRRVLDGYRFPPIFRVYEDLYFMAMVYPQARMMVWVDVPMYFYFKQDGGTLNSLSIRRTDAFDVLRLLEQEYLVTQQLPLVRAVRERRLSVAFNILRLLARQPHTDVNKAMAHRCWQHIRQLRGESIRDPHARLKNRLMSAFSYLLTLCK